MSVDPNQLAETLHNARTALLDARTPAGHWEGELSSSALSTATAIFALSLDRSRGDLRPLADRGSDWLMAHQNPDGGWGDTIKSFSNISTTALCWAALSFREERFGDHNSRREAIARCEAWLASQAGGIDPDHLIPAIIARYGKDRTFSVPILTTCALAGRLGAGPDAWKRIPQLPFELAAFPQRWFKWLRLPVVSYALPALIAIGLVRHRRRPTRNPLTRAARRLACTRAVRLLEKIQPASGGFLEATPLTSFVVMSLIGAGFSDHPVVHKGIEFLIRSARPDGSWPIDTNLATWVTTLSVNALAIDPDFSQLVPEPDRLRLRNWLLNQQYRSEHPYTLADPGCWAWTDLSGGVPDADDTPGALLALHHLTPADDQTSAAARAAVKWLLNLQNRDGGIPTFCRGWGQLPFDRSSPDLTAHALRAWAASDPSNLTRKARERAIEYLIRTQRPDGAWVPLWFGNQHVLDDQNPTYGTSRVLRIGAEGHGPRWNEAIARGVNWLLCAQNADGGWGGGAGAPSSIEETALAVEALSCLAPGDDSSATGVSPVQAMPSGETPNQTRFRSFSMEHHQPGRDAHATGKLCTAMNRGVNWLIEHTRRGTAFDPSPIGFYFARLWYYEELYPLIFTVAALNAFKFAGNRAQGALEVP